eukprot:11974750-Alexandrium_andersonii.AAC.1
MVRSTVFRTPHLSLRGGGRISSRRHQPQSRVTTQLLRHGCLTRSNLSTISSQIQVFGTRVGAARSNHGSPRAIRLIGHSLHS